MRLQAVSLLLSAVLAAIALGTPPPERDWEAVELTGTVTDYWFTRNWRSRYWREDFTFVMTEASGKSWRIISREPTPHYNWRMGTTYTGLKVDWDSKPRVKVLAVKALDRIPADFYDFKLQEENLATALIVSVEMGLNVWKEFYVNNWFHKWGDKADKLIYSHYADKTDHYRIFGFARAQAAPFDKPSQTIIGQHADQASMTFQGRVKATNENSFGYEIELIDLIGRDLKKGGAKVLYGDAKSIPLLDDRKPKE